jgi:hypothetical protein
VGAIAVGDATGVRGEGVTNRIRLFCVVGRSQIGTLHRCVVALGGRLRIAVDLEGE